MGRPWTKLVAAIIALADNRRVRPRELGGASHHRGQDRLEIQRRRHRWTAVAQRAELRLASLVGRGCHVKPPWGANRRIFLAPPYAVYVWACGKATSCGLLAHARDAQHQPRTHARILSKACPAEQETDGLEVKSVPYGSRLPRRGDGRVWVMRGI